MLLQGAMWSCWKNAKFPGFGLCLGLVPNGPTLQFSYRSTGPWLPSSSDLGGIPPPKSWGPESEAPIVGTWKSYGINYSWTKMGTFWDPCDLRSWVDFHRLKSRAYMLEIATTNNWQWNQKKSINIHTISPVEILSLGIFLGNMTPQGH